MNELATILAVDDTPESLALLVSLLTVAGYQVRPAKSGELALAAVAAKAPDLILLEIRMKGVDGLEVCRRLKAREETRQIPIILISAFVEVKERVEGLQLGAADYITKPFQPEELLTRVRTHLSLRQANEQLRAAATERQRAEAELRQGLDRAERSRRALLSTLEDQKRTEETLLASEQKYRELVDNLNDVIFTIDTKGIVTYVSAPVLQVSGFAPGELIGRPFSEVVHADDLPVLEARVRDVLEGRLKLWEFRVRTKDGDVRWVRTSSRPIVEGGRATGIRGVLSDVTERKQAEAKMEAQNEELRRWHQATLGREGRVLELKKEVNELLAQAGQPPRYPSVLDEK
jgi:PAS domain S-box-containing protein